ncbi:MAG: 16S rRNA (cytidine(1402)-2'-O)-methyltransferase [Eggerthellaceae bacterium]|nr:16S rRNA (cytidine(1402)-2'-O)-methyltransferase [Eggerthellaceae bacterium]
MAGIGKLSIVPTPIGNLGDITLRAVDTLRAADAVFCEDTRVTGKLMSHLGIHRPLHRLDENTIRQKSDAVLDRLSAGEAIAYCSDAGMPGVSDPGMHLIAKARQAGFDVEVLPGASAAVTAFVNAGFQAPSFYFGGFLPRKASERERLFDTIRSLPAQLIFYESPHRLNASMQDVANAFPDREVCICRELTKLHEEVLCGSAVKLAQDMDARAANGSIKGEIVIVVDAPSSAEQPQATEADAKERAAQLVGEGMRAKDVARALEAELGIPKNAGYDMALAAKDGLEGAAHPDEGCTS